MSEPLLVRSMTLESDGVLSIELVDPSGRELRRGSRGRTSTCSSRRGCASVLALR